MAAAEELSVSKAAERVHVSQPALSRQIRFLEEEIGLQLFDRTKQRIHLTAAGKFFLLKARQLLCDSEMAVQRVREDYGGARKILRLGFLSPFLDDEERKRFDVLRLSKRRFVVVLPENHRLARRKSVKLAELAADDWVSLSNAFFSKRREFLIETCAKAGFVPRIVSETDSLPMMLAEIGTGGGVGLMTGHAAKFPPAGCALVALTAPVVSRSFY